MNFAEVANKLLTPSFTNEHLVVYSAGSALLFHALTQIWEPPILTAVPAILLIVIAEPVLLATVGSQTISRAITASAIINTTFLAVLFSSIAVYRLFFHRLSRFPGPTLAALSKFWNFSVTIDGKTPARIQALHRQYGDVVRIGPNELSILNASAIPQVLGIAGKMDKGPWYKGSFTKKGMSVHALRGIHEHAQRRKFWDRGFSGKALLDYSVFVNQCGEEWIEKLKKITAKPGTSINISDWVSFVSFDTMGYAGFGDTFGMVRDGKAHFYMTTIESAMKGLTMFSEIPWIMPLLSMLPAGREQADMYEFSMATTKHRQERGTAGKPDVFSYLVGEDQPKQADLTLNELDADIRTVIIAGSDTVASTTTFIIYYLLQQPAIMKQLQDEVEHLRGKHFDGNDLANLKLLNAVINETLRVKTVVPSKSQRVVPREGAMLANQYIPGGAFVSVPFRATHHDPRNFSPEPSTWRPDRWITPEKEQAMNPKAFIPFSTGPFNCAGRLLALLELRVFTTMFVHNFNGRITPGFDLAKYEDSIVDRFTVQKGELQVELTARQ